MKFFILMLISSFSIVLLNAKTPSIQTSIIPLQSLVSMITENSSNVGVIIKHNTSPHHTQLSYNDIKKIKTANLIFLVSRNFEKEILKNIDEKNTQLIFLDEIQGLTILEFNNQSYSKYSTHAHSNNNIKDYHIWLSPTNADLILKTIAENLSKIDPSNQKLYLSNYKKYSVKLNDLKLYMIKELKNKSQSFMVYHNAWGYLIHDLGLKNYKGSIVSNEKDHHLDTSMSAKDIITLNQYIKDNNISCIFIEPQFQDKSVNNIIKINNVKHDVLDPIGEPSSNLIENYFVMMKKNVQSIKSCL